MKVNSLILVNHSFSASWFQFETLNIEITIITHYNDKTTVLAFDSDSL